MGVTIEPFFLPYGPHSLFCVFYTCPVVEAKGCILYFPPFAEEMHKSRRMAALQAREFARKGYPTLILDPVGCGDSSGDFEDADWNLWLNCGLEAHHWLSAKLKLPVILWGLRTGALIISTLAERLVQIEALIFWQPVLNGELFLNQFIRIKLVNEMLSSNLSPTSSVRNSVESLEAGNSIEVGGYMISSSLGTQLRKTKLQELPPTAPVYWFEISDDGKPSDASLKLIQNWTEKGIKVEFQGLSGVNFWSSSELETCQPLLKASTQVLEYFSNP